MDYVSILNIILNQIGTPFNLSVFCNGSTMSFVLYKMLSKEVMEDLESQLTQLVSRVCLKTREDPDRVYILLEH